MSMSKVKCPTSKLIKKCLKVSVLLVPLAVFFPLFLIFYITLGLLDVCRNEPADFDTIKRYFIGNGILTWLLSPFNLILDLFSLKNKGIYTLDDLPKAHREELSALLHDINTHKEHIKKEMSTRLSEIDRGMLFFKWYGDNIDTSFDMPCFHKDYKLIKTIGVSAFNQQKATSIHFGPLRITLRVLYNLTPTNEGEVYIQVGGQKHYWRDEPLFIFDDTLQHQSVNYSDQIRHCMFIDIVRPTNFHAILNTLLKATKFITAKTNGIFYKKWVFLK
jgi:hypothetical protein